MAQSRSIRRLPVRFGQGDNRRRALSGEAVAYLLASRLAENIGCAATPAARYAPFRAVCLPQAMAVRAMLERRGEIVCGV